MAMQTQTELEQFHQFVGERLADGKTSDSVADALEEFRQLTDLRAKLQVAIDQSERGESGPFDAEAMKQRVRERLAERGIGKTP